MKNKKEKIPIQQDLETIISLMEKDGNQQEIVNLAKDISADVDLLTQIPRQLPRFFGSRTNPSYGEFIDELKGRMINLGLQLNNFN
jgi:hypothetical protein